MTAKTDAGRFAPPPPWAECATLLVDVASGRRPADLVVRNGRWVNVHSGEIIPGTDLAMAAGRFAYCGPDAAHTIGPATEVIEAGGRYLVPGLCDGHMHVESGMVTVTEFCPRGDPPRHDGHVHRPARDRQRARAERRAADA